MPEPQDLNPHDGSRRVFAAVLVITTHTQHETKYTVPHIHDSFHDPFGSLTRLLANLFDPSQYSQDSLHDPFEIELGGTSNVEMLMNIK